MPAQFENVTCDLRFVLRLPLDAKPGQAPFRILQQRWDIYENGLSAVTRAEWRDVPLVTE